MQAMCFNCINWKFAEIMKQLQKKKKKNTRSEERRVGQGLHLLGGLSIYN